MDEEKLGNGELAPDPVDEGIDDGTGPDRPAAVFVPLSATDGESELAYLYGGSDGQWDTGGGCVG